MAVKKKVTKEQAASLIGKVQGKTMTDVTQRLAGVKVATLGLIDDVSNTTSALIAELQETQSAIDLKRTELKELHAIEVEATTLEALQLQIEETKQRIVEEQEQVRLERTRGEEAYEYEQDLSRRKENDEWERTKRTREEQAQNVIAARYQVLEARERAMGDAEKMRADLTKEIQDLKAQHGQEVARAVAIATNSLKKDLEHGFALERIQNANETNLLKSQVASLEFDMEKAEASIDSLTEQLQQATARVQQIAEKAIDGAAQQRVTVNAGSSDQPTKR